MDKEGELLDGLGGLRDVRVRAKSKGMIFWPKKGNLIKIMEGEGEKKCSSYLNFPPLSYYQIYFIVSCFSVYMLD